MTAQRPSPKQFEITKYEEIISKLHVNMSELEFERISEVVVPDILINYEGFRCVEKGPDFRGTPFDFFGFKESRPYIIEYKGSLNSFNTPGETQKKRLQKILGIFDDLHVALLQVKLLKSRYRIFYDDEMEQLFRGKQTPIEPVVSWLAERIKAAQ